MIEPRINSNTLVQPLLSIHQLHEITFRYLIGCGVSASYIYSLLPAHIQNQITFVDLLGRQSFDGRPAIGIREFIRRSTPDEPVIYAVDGIPVLPVLIFARQACVLSASVFARSHYHATKPARGRASRLGVISTTPRSGTHRIMYFWYALNEILRNPRQIPSAHKLYLYYRSANTRPDSYYYLYDVYKFLGIDSLHSGHFVPPGSLSLAGANPALACLHSNRWQNYIRCVAAHPDLHVMSHTEVGAVEPDLPYGNNSRVRYAFVVRSIVDQITSVVTVYEKMSRALRCRGAENWSLSDYIANIDSQPFGLTCNLDWQLPVVLQQAIVEDKTVAEIILRDGYLFSLIRDYSWQCHSAQPHECTLAPCINACTFAYEDMIRDESRFFRELVSFIVGNTLSAFQIDRIEQARHLTAGNRKLERALGHSLSYSDYISNPIRRESHMTDLGSEDDRGCRAAVVAALEPHRDRIKGIFDDMRTSLQSGESASLSHLLHDEHLQS